MLLWEDASKFAQIPRLLDTPWAVFFGNHGRGGGGEHRYHGRGEQQMDVFGAQETKNQFGHCYKGNPEKGPLPHQKALQGSLNMNSIL